MARQARGRQIRAAVELAYLANYPSVAQVDWTDLQPDSRHNWVTPENEDDFSILIPVENRAAKAANSSASETVFSEYGRGVATSRDQVVADFDKDSVVGRVKDFIDYYNSEVDRFKRSDGRNEAVDDFVRYDQIKWSRDLKLDLVRGHYARFENQKIRNYLYRPFCKAYLFFDKILNEEVYVFPRIFPTPTSENFVLVVSDIGYRAKDVSVLATKWICDLHLCASSDSHQCFPYYIYEENGTDRRENITDWALGQFQEHYRDKKITKWDIFHYVYGVLHQPAYREKFGENLKLELPRIPFLADFRGVAEAGRKLGELHVGYEEVEPWPLRWVYEPGKPIDFRVEKMRLSKDKTELVVNPTLTLADIPPEVFEYRLGNRSALDWVVDQYQVSTDKRSGITSDPNRDDDPEYIVRLVERVVRVSVETVRIIKTLPAEVG